MIDKPGLVEINIILGPRAQGDLFAYARHHKEYNAAGSDLILKMKRPRDTVFEPQIEYCFQTSLVVLTSCQGVIGL